MKEAVDNWNKDKEQEREMLNSMQEEIEIKNQEILGE